MNHLLHLTFAVALLFLSIVPNVRGEEGKAGKSRDPAEIEAATRLQLFLDHAEFAPGKIDGRYGEFTVKALALYREAHGQQQPAALAGQEQSKKTDAPPDVTGLDLARIDPVFITYTVTEADLQNIGDVPESVPEQAKLKSLPYKNAAEAIAEKFHADVDFLAELNPGKTKSIKAGDEFKVPNVEPFELAAVKSLKPGSEVDTHGINEIDGEPATNGDQPDKAGKETLTDRDAAPSTTAVKIDVKTSMLTVHDEGKLIAAYPVTIGSEQTESPVGDWKVRAVAKMPNFRYDKAMLNKGVRSDNFHMLPPGPNNPVGVIWIALNKKGIGLHGTNEPDTIGRSASHGCVRLANWDVVRLAAKIKAGAPVVIH